MAARRLLDTRRAHVRCTCTCCQCENSEVRRGLYSARECVALAAAMRKVRTVAILRDDALRALRNDDMAER